MCAAYFDRLENGVLRQEFAFYEPKEIGVDGGATIQHLVRCVNGEWFAIISYIPMYGSKQPTWNYLIRRLAPAE
jgi:hypothetical protein